MSFSKSVRDVLEANPKLMQSVNELGNKLHSHGVEVVGESRGIGNSNVGDKMLSRANATAQQDSGKAR